MRYFDIRCCMSRVILEADPFIDCSLPNNCRCPGNELESLSNILEPISHRGFKASFNKQYPAEAFKPRINSRKAQSKISQLFGKVRLHCLFVLNTAQIC